MKSKVKVFLRGLGVFVLIMVLLIIVGACARVDRRADWERAHDGAVVRGWHQNPKAAAARNRLLDEIYFED